jgi:hypothetical protein
VPNTHQRLFFHLHALGNNDDRNPSVNTAIQCNYYMRNTVGSALLNA